MVSTWTDRLTIKHTRKANLKWIEREKCHSFSCCICTFYPLENRSPWELRLYPLKWKQRNSSSLASENKAWKIVKIFCLSSMIFKYSDVTVLQMGQLQYFHIFGWDDSVYRNLVNFGWWSLKAVITVTLLCRISIKYYGTDTESNSSK